MTYASSMIDSSLGITNLPADKIGFVEQFERDIANNVVKSGVDSALYGTDFKDNLQAGLAISVSNVGFRAVGDTALFGGLEDGSLGKVALHSIVGAGTAALMGEDAAAGAAAAGANELLGFISADLDKETQLTISGFIGAAAAGAVGGNSESVEAGQSIARSATEYNRQLHQDEVDWLKDDKNIQKYADKQSLTLEKARKELTQTTLALSDNIWAKILGEPSPEAKEYIESNLDSIKNITEVEKADFANGLQNIAQNEENLNFYKENVHGEYQTSINDILNEKAETGVKDLIKTIDILEEQGAVKSAQILKEKIYNYINDSTIEKMTDAAKAALYDIVTDVQTGALQLQNTTGLSPNDIAKVYNITQDEAVEVKNVVLLIAATNLTGVVKDLFKDGIKLGVDGSNKGIYDSKEIRNALESKDGTENVASTTVPKNPQQASSSRNDVIVGEDGSKAVQVTMEDGTIKNISYDDRNLPIFDDVSVFTTKIDSTKSYDGQMKQATKDMWEAIKNDPDAKSKFTQAQLDDIKAGSKKIEGFTWHHNAQSSPNNMQLVPEYIHNANQGGVPHTGQNALKDGL